MACFRGPRSQGQRPSRGRPRKHGTPREPPHVHVERDDCEAKFWLDPVRLERSHGFRRKEINRIRELVEEHQAHLLESWHEFFGG